jgi:type I restriction enzyme S subunit
VKLELPDRWTTVEIEKTLDVEYGEGLPKRERKGGDVPVYGSSGITGYHSTHLINEPGIVIGRKGSAGAVSLAKEPFWPIDTTYYVTPPSEFDINFLFYQLKMLGLERLDKSTAVPSLSRDDIYDNVIAIPSRSEQERIVAKIEELISKLDSGVAELQNAKHRLEQYRRAVLKDAIAGKLSERWRAGGRSQSDTITDRSKGLFDGIELLEADSEYPETWDLTTLDQVSDVETGATPLRSNSEFWEGEIPWVKSGAVTEGEIQSADEFITEKALDETTVTLFPPETLVVAMYGQGSTRGKIATLKIRATTNQACAGIIIPDELSFLRPWVKITFKDHYHELRRKAAGGVQPNLNLGILRSMEIPLPPENEIKYICDIVERQRSIIKETDQSITENIKRAKRLRQSILKHAFEGKLVPQKMQSLNWKNRKRSRR